MLVLSTGVSSTMAEDAPRQRSVVKVRPKIQMVSAEEENAPSDEAVERWGQLKSRYRALQEEQERASAAANRSVNTAIKTPIRPFPSDNGSPVNDEDAWLEEEATEPETSYRPVKMVPQPKDDLDFVPEAFLEPPSQKAAWNYGNSQSSDQNPERGSEAVPSDPSPLPQTIEGNDPSSDQSSTDSDSTPRGGLRRPRTIHDIRPTYDVNYDSDIREFARQQADQYNIHRPQGPYPERNYSDVVYQWEPNGLMYYPLYFEDPALERYGHKLPYGLQPVASITRFGVQLVGLPYQMAIDSPCITRSALGWYRPGDCVPKLHYQIPLNAKAALVEAGVITGMFYAIP